MSESGERDGLRVGDRVTMRNRRSGTVGIIDRIDPSHGLGRWPFLVVFPPSGGFSWCAADWLTRVEVEASREGSYSQAWIDRVEAVVTEAHEENLGLKHREGFCEACADAYLVAQRAVPGGPSDA